MRTILIGVVAVAGFALFEGLFHTIRYFSERKQDELQRRLQSLGTTGGGALSLLRQGNLSQGPGIDAFLRLFPAAARAEALPATAAVRRPVAAR